MRRPRARARGTRGEAVPRPYGSEDVLVGAGLKPALDGAKRCALSEAGVPRRSLARRCVRGAAAPGLRKRNPGCRSATNRLQLPRI